MNMEFYTVEELEAYEIHLARQEEETHKFFLSLAQDANFWEIEEIPYNEDDEPEGL